MTSTTHAGLNAEAEDAKSYVLEVDHLPIKVPKFFNVRRPARCWLRIEEIAARFIYFPNRFWKIGLNAQELQILDRCFGLTLVQRGQGYLSMDGQRFLDPVFRPAVTCLEGLWELEQKIINDLHVSQLLYRRYVKHPPEIALNGSEREDWQLNSDPLLCMLVRRLRGLVIHQDFLMAHIGEERSLFGKHSQLLTTDVSAVLRWLDQINDLADTWNLAHSDVEIWKLSDSQINVRLDFTREGLWLLYKQEIAKNRTTSA